MRVDARFILNALEVPELNGKEVTKDTEFAEKDLSLPLAD